MSIIETGFESVLRASWQAAALAVIVLAIQWTAGRWISPRARYGLWMLVVLRLALPVTPLHFGWDQRDAKPQAVAIAAAKGPTIKVVYGPVPAGVIGVPRASETVIPSDAPSPQPSPEGRGRNALALAWFAVMVALVIRLLARGVWFARRLRRFETVADAKLLALLEESRQLMGVRRSIGLLWADDLTAPAMTGVFRPVILVPREIASRLGEDEIRFVFLHELAHVKRWDLAIDWIVALLMAAHWFNPLAWYAMRRRRAERELACDAMVLKICGRGQRRRYGAAIVKLVEGWTPVRVPALGIVENKKQLTRRITMIARYRPASWGATVFALVTLLVVGCMALTDARSQEKKIPAKPQPISTTQQANVDEERKISPDERPPTAADHAVQVLLDRKLPEINFQGTGFSDVIDFLRDVSSANIFVNWRALEAAEIDRNTPVSVRVRDVKFSKALTMVLNDVGGGTTKLGYVIDEGVLTISTEEDLSRNVETRVYDVRDLLVNVEEPKSQPATQPSTAREQIIERIENLITDTIAPDTWRDAGGTIGSFHELKSQLIITQTPENHEQIAKLLGQLRERQADQIIVEARFISLDDTGMNSLPADLRKRVEGPLTASEPDAGKLSFLSPEELTVLLKTAQKSKWTSLITAPRLTLFNGQHAWVSVTRKQDYVSDFTMTRTAGGDMRYEPRNGSVDSGMVFDVCGTIGSDRKSISLALHPTFTTLMEMKSVPFAAAPSEKLMVQVPEVKKSELNTTLSVPDGATMMLGGLSNSSVAEDGTVTRPMLMLVNARMILQREK